MIINPAFNAFPPSTGYLAKGKLTKPCIINDSFVFPHKKVSSLNSIHRLPFPPFAILYGMDRFGPEVFFTTLLFVAF